MTGFEFLPLLPSSRLLRSADVSRVVQLLRAGSLAVLPTETGHLLAAIATSPDALRAAFRVKARAPQHAMHVACASVEMAQEFAELDALARRILARFTPGPVSVVVRQNRRLPSTLVAVDATVGIRIPDHPATLQVVAALGAPVTATSLNLSGGPAVALTEPALRSLDWPEGVVAVIADQEAVVYDEPSTLVRTTTGRVELLRAGPVTGAEIAAVATAES